MPDPVQGPSAFEREYAHRGIRALIHYDKDAGCWRWVTQVTVTLSFNNAAPDMGTAETDIRRAVDGVLDLVNQFGDVEIV